MRICLYIICVLMAGNTGLYGGTLPKVDEVIRADPRTGQFVKTVHVVARVVPVRVVAPLSTSAEQPAGPETLAGSSVRSMVEETARQYEVSPELVDSVIQVESNYNPYAVSPKGAQGLMQLMPATARRFGVRNTFDPKDNVEGGVRYLKFLQETFKDERLAIAAYNAGEGAVQKYGNVPPYQETMTYVAIVGRKYGQARRAEQQKLASKQASNPRDNPPPEPQHRPLAQFTDSDGKLHLITQ